MPLSPTVLGTLIASNLFAGVPRDLVTTLAASAVRRRFGHGETIFHGGESASFLGVVATGLVKLVRQVPDGPHCILAIWGPRQTIGNLAVIGREAYPGDAVVLSDEAQVVTIGASDLLAAAERSPAIAAALGRSLTEHGRALHEKIAIMSAGPVERRLRALLSQLMERFGDEYEDGTRQIPVALSRGDLASIIGATIETTIRTMSRWQKQGLLETTPDGFRILDPAWLTTAAPAPCELSRRPAA